MPKLSFIDSLLRRGKHSVPSDILKGSPALNVREGESIIVTYASAAYKMKIFSAYILEGLENGDLIDYVYPDEENEAVRATLKEYGIDVEKHEREGSLVLSGLTEYFMPNGKFDVERAVRKGLRRWTEAKSEGYKHIRDIEDVGDFSFCNGQWQKWIEEYYLDPRWDDPDLSEWVIVKQAVGGIYVPFILEITAVNVARMTKKQVDEILKTFGEGSFLPRRYFIDLLKDRDSFSKSIDLDHDQLIGRKILLEFDPVSDYEKVIDNLATESRANVEPIYVFTPSTSPIHTYLSEQSVVKFFLTTLSSSVPEPTSENTVLLPAKNTPIILDALSKVLETYKNANVCFVFDILSDFLTTIGREKTFTFLRHALDLLSSEKTTSFFLLNTSAHETEVVSRVRNFFSNQLACDKNGLEITKISQF